MQKGKAAGKKAGKKGKGRKPSATAMVPQSLLDILEAKLKTSNQELEALRVRADYVKSDYDRVKVELADSKLSCEPRSAHRALALMQAGRLERKDEILRARQKDLEYAEQRFEEQSKVRVASGAVPLSKSAPSC